MTELNKRLGSMDYDGLIADIYPKLVVSGGTSGDGKLVVLGTAATGDEVLTANCILCDDVEVGTSDDVTVPVYLTGCFNTNKCIVADSYTMTEADKDALREGGIFFKAAAPAL